MEQALKERLVGSVVLLGIIIIGIPLILGEPNTRTKITQTNIPKPPAAIQPNAGNTPLIPHSIRQQAQKLTANIDTNNEPNKITSKQGKASRDTRSSVITQSPRAKLTKQTKTTTQLPPTVSKQAPASNTPKLTAWIVQLGGFASKENAKALAKKLQQAQFPAFIEPLNEAGVTLYRVRVGPEILHADAEAMRQKIATEFHLDGIILEHMSQ